MTAPQPRTFRSPVELEQALREWTSWAGGADYDRDQMVHLLAACLDSLRRHTLEPELEEVGELLIPEQADFLAELAGRVACPAPKRRGLNAV